MIESIISKIKLIMIASTKLEQESIMESVISPLPKRKESWRKVLLTITLWKEKLINLLLIIALFLKLLNSSEDQKNLKDIS